MRACLFATASAIGAVLFSATLLQSPAGAQAPDRARFELKEVDGGFLRLDRDSGATSFCAPSGDGYSCRSADVTADAEIARLKARIAALEAEAKAPSSGLPPIPPQPKDPPSAGDSSFRLPTDEEVDRLASFLEKTLERFKRFGAELERQEEPERQRL